MRELAARMLALAMNSEDEQLLVGFASGRVNMLTKPGCSTPHSVQLLSPTRKPTDEGWFIQDGDVVTLTDAGAEIELRRQAAIGQARAE